VPTPPVQGLMLRRPRTRAKLDLPATLQPALAKARGLLAPLSPLEAWSGRANRASWRGEGLGHSEILIPGNQAERRPTIRLVYDNIVRLRRPVHMITNAANTNFIERGGVAGAIWTAGGRPMQDWLRARNQLGNVAPGQGESSPGFDIANTRYVAHMVGPDFNIAAQQNMQLLYDVYANLLGQPGEVANPNNRIYRVGDPLFGGLTTPQPVETLATVLISSNLFGGYTDESLEAALAAFINIPTDLTEIRIVTNDINQIEEILDWVARARGGGGGGAI
jgi:O-acetyl-ADP-ribose deacetylase (regulator of RNase III)